MNLREGMCGGDNMNGVRGRKEKAGSDCGGLKENGP